MPTSTAWDCKRVLECVINVSEGRDAAVIDAIARAAGDHVLDVHVSNLRRKLGDGGRAPKYVVTVRGVGYRMGTGS